MTTGHDRKGLMGESTLAKRKWRRFHNLAAELDPVAGAVSGHRSRAWVPGSTPE